MKRLVIKNLKQRLVKAMTFDPAVDLNPTNSCRRHLDLSQRRMLFEAMEPRVLLSADLNPLPNPLEQQQDVTQVEQGVFQSYDTGTSPVIDMSLADPALDPAGSLIHIAPINADFSVEGETDSYTVTVDRGQKLTIGILPEDGSIRSSLSVTDPDGMVHELEADTAGQPLVLENFDSGDGGTYTIGLTSLEGAGNYEVFYMLNAQPEPESYDVTTTNDTIDTAVNIDGSSVSLNRDEPADRLAVFGTLENGTEDWYSFTLQAGQSVTLALTQTQTDPDEGDAPEGALRLALYAPAQSLLAIGETSSSNVEQVIRSFIVQESGTYYALISGTQGLEYTLLVTRNVDFDLEPNNSLENAQDISSSNRVFGAVDGSLVIDEGTGSSGTISLPVDLYDSTGYRWDVQGDGTINDGTNDAFDSGVRNTDFSSWFSSQSAETEDGGREVVIGPAYYEDVQVSRKIYVPEDQSFARFLEIITNPNEYTIGYTVPIQTNLGSDGGESFVWTSSGDSTVSAEDTWVITDDQDGMWDPTVTHLIAGNDGNVSPSMFTRSGDNIAYSYDLILAPGETKIIMHFASQAPDQATALERIGLLEQLELGVLTGMSAEERSQVVNFALGYGTNSTDAYRFLANAGDELHIFTTTPGGGDAEPVNILDPVLELYAPDGALVASSDNDAADGRNAEITYTAAQNGAYRVVVSAAAETTGEYVLQVQGASGSVSSPLTVVSSSVANDAVLNASQGFPDTITLTFSSAINLTSLSANDFVITWTSPDGNSYEEMTATAVTAQDGRTLLVDCSGQGRGEGFYTLSLASGMVTSLQGSDNEEVAINFSLDTTPPTVLSTSVGMGEGVASGDLTVNVYFSEGVTWSAYYGAYTLWEQFSGQGVTPTSVSYHYDPSADTEHAYVLTLDYQELADGRYNLNVWNGNFRDAAGNYLNGNQHESDLQLNFYVDSDIATLPTPLENKIPAGSLIYEQEAFGALYQYYNGSVQEDIDMFTLDLDVNQRVSILVSPLDANLQAYLALTYFNPDSNDWELVATVDAGAAGNPCVLNNAQVEQAGLYRIEVSNQENTNSAGRFRLGLLLNAAGEEESAGLASNDDLASAQDLDASVIDLGNGAQRGAARGDLPSGVDTTTVASESFDNFWTPGPEWKLTSSGTNAHMSFGQSYGSLSMYTDGYGAASNEAVWTVDLASLDNAILRFTEEGYATSGQPFDGPFLGTYNADGIAISADGVTWYPVFDCPNSAEWRWEQHTIDLAATAASIRQNYDPSFRLGDNFKIKFQQSSNTTNFEELHWDDLRIESSTFSQNEDWYKFSVAAGEQVDVVLSSDDASQGEDVSLELFDHQGQRVATGLPGGSDVDQVISMLSQNEGTYYVRVSSLIAGQYSLIFTRNLDFGLKGLAEPQDITQTGHVLGALSGGDSIDHYQVQCNGGDSVTLNLKAIGGEGGKPVNGLVPGLSVYDPSGNIINVSFSTSLSGELLGGFTANTDGAYRLNVVASSGVGGEYILTTTGATANLPTTFTATGSSVDEGSIFQDLPASITLEFSSALDLRTLSADDLVVSWVSPDGTSSVILGGAKGYTVVDGNTVTFDVSGIGNGDGTYQFAIAGGALHDLRGVDLSPMVFSCQVIGQESSLPTPITPKLPYGGLIHESQVNGYFFGPGDDDVFTVDLDAGQTITIALVPGDSDFQGRLDVFSPENQLLATASATTSGQKVVLQTLPVTAAGSYRVVANSTAGGGSYQLKVELNAALEVELSIGANDSHSTAQDIDASFIDIGNAASRGAVRGVLNGGNSVDQDWFSFTLTAGQATTLALAHDQQGHALNNNANITLFDANGVQLTMGIFNTDNVACAIQDFIPDTSGTYFAKITGSTAGFYDLIITRGATFNLQQNSGLPQDVSASGTVLGSTIFNSLGKTDQAASGTTTLGVTLGDASGYIWDIQGDGSIGNGSSDAYDGGMDNTNFPYFYSAQTEEDGREIVIGPTILNGVEVSRKIYVPADQNFARYLEVIHNPGTSSVTYIVPIATNLGSNGYERYVMTSSGDSVVSVTDNWLITDDSTVGTSSGDPVVTHVIAGDGGRLRPVTFTRSWDNVNYSYNLTLAPGETQIIMHFASQSPNQATALATATQLSQLELDALAGMSLAERSMVVNFSLGDVYQFTANAGDQLVITTITPGDGAGQPVNELDTRLVLRNANGIQVALDDNSAADGRNAHIAYTVPADSSGKYVVEVQAAGGNGSYVLSMTGATATTESAPPEIVSTTPANGQNVGAPPTELVVQLSEGVRADSISIDDLTIDGAASVVGVEMISGNQIRFLLDVPPGEGSFNYWFAAGAFNSLQGVASLAYSGSFIIDVVPPHLVSQTPELSTNAPFNTLRFTFSEPMGIASFDSSDISLIDPNGYAVYVTSFTASGNDVIVTFADLWTGGTYALSLDPNVSDEAGNLLDQNQNGIPGETADRYTSTVEVRSPDLAVQSVTVNPLSGLLGSAISVTWTVRNVGTSTATVGSWNDYVWISRDGMSSYGLGGVWYDNTAGLNPGEEYTVTATFTVPLWDELSAGSYFVRVGANSYSQPESTRINNELNSSSFTLAVPPLPDLQVTQITLPDTVQEAGKPFALTWTESNLGAANASGGYYTAVYLSADTNDSISAGDRLLGTYRQAAGPSAQSNLTRSASITVPLSMAGSWYIKVSTDNYNYIYERGANESNNILVSSTTVTAIVPTEDLTPVALNAPTNGVLGQAINVDWTVRNIGTGPTTTTWQDRLYLSRDAVWDDNDTLLTTQTITTPIAVNGEYTRTVSVTPQLSTNLPEGDYYLVLKTDANSGQPEVNENNNAIAVPVHLVLPQLADLTIGNVTVDQTNIHSGDPITVSYILSNQGTASASNIYNYVYLCSTPTITSSSTSYYLGQDRYGGTLAAGDSVTRTAQFTTRIDSPGDWYVVVVADGGNRIYEHLNESNNTAATAGTLHASLPPLPDLVVTEISAPIEALSGQQIQVSWTLENRGDGTTRNGWTDRVWLSSGDGLGTETLLGEFQFDGELTAGGSLTRTQIVTLPATLSGDWRVTVTTDVYGTVYEYVNESNNTTVDDQTMAIRLQQFPNLTVTEVAPPTTAYSGQQTLVEWTVTNSGPGSTSAPLWYDRVYLSADAVWDASDILLGQVQNPSYLAGGESYRSSLAVQLPQGIEGTYHFIVKADSANNVLEYLHEDDNQAVSAATTVELTPPPDLQVTNVMAPAQTFSGQAMNLSWTVTNAGSGRTAEDLWYDRIYLSTDASFDNADQLLATVKHTGALTVGSSYQGTTTVTLPIGISGNYYFLVATDSNNQVYEHASETNNTGANTTATQVLLTPPPDLEVENITVPATAQASHDLSIGYRVSNLGSTTTPNTSWTDAVYLSTDAQWDEGDLLLTSREHRGALVVGQYYDENFTLTLPNGLSGAYHLLVKADSKEAVFELDNLNNIQTSAQPILISSNPADLAVTAVQAPLTGEAGKQIRVDWTVSNLGSGDSAVTAWKDQIILSTDETVGNSDDIILATFDHAGLLDANSSYSRSELVNLPISLVGDYRLFVVADSANAVYEGAVNTGNASASQTITIARHTPDLQVSAVTLPSDISVPAGAPVTINWTVTNTGDNRTNANFWYDAVYLSATPAITEQSRLLATYRHANALESGQSYVGAAELTLPADLATGNYYLVVRTDVTNLAFEGVAETNNDASSQALAVLANPTAVVRPDLALTSVVAPSEAYSGQNFTLTWTVRNDGDATAATWVDAVYLSRDQIFDKSSDVYLGYADFTGSLDANTGLYVQGLAAGASYSVTRTFTVPQGLSGPLYVFVATDSKNKVENESNELNNRGYDPQAMEVHLAPPADLVVGSITVPAEGLAGHNATITYTVANQGSNAAVGSWYDSIYLSQDGVWDVDDLLFSRVQIAGPVAGSAGYTRTVTAALPGLPPGEYQVIIRSDIRNAIPESNETNNIGISLEQTTVDVDALTLGTSASGSLSKGQSVYYRVEVAAGETLRFTLDGTDNDLAASELYVKYGSVPTRADFDLAGNEPFQTDQVLTIPQSKAGTYYVMVCNTQGNGSTYALTAEALHFSITDLSLASGSNLGQVTVQISGAQYSLATAAALISEDGQAHTASRVWWKDSTELWATFDLRGLNTGLYDLQVTDGARSATLTDGFTVTHEAVGAVEYSLSTPSALRPGQTGIVRVYYSNTGATDVVAPLLTVSGNVLLKQLGAAEYSQGSVQFLGISAEGPAGILAPGASGTYTLQFVPDFTGGGTVNLTVASPTGNQPLDWDAILESSKPADVDAAAWAQIKANLIAQLGSTALDYQNALAETATYLNQLEDRTNDVARLFSLHYLKAAGSGSLLFESQPGVLGWGRSFAWDITASVQTDGSVVVSVGGVEQTFTRNSDGSYASTGTSTLSQNGGVFEYRQQNGTRIVFNLDGSFSLIEDSNGNRQLATYAGGRLVRVDASNGDFQTFVYNAQSRLTQTIDQAGRTTTYGYDVSGAYLLSVATVEGTTTYTYNTAAGPAQHQISSITSLDGLTRYYEYDAQGRLQRAYTEGGAESTTYSYVGVNEVIVTDATGASTHLWLNERGQVAQIEDALGRVSQMRYDGDGNLIEVVNTDGSTSTMSYDEAGNVRSVQDALGNTVTFDYDAVFGQLTQVTDQRGNAIGYGYDAHGNLNRITYADGSSETYSYDSEGQLSVAVNRRGQSITYIFDDQGRLIRKTYTDGSTAAYAYDSHGNLISAIDADSSTTYEYDGVDRLIKVTDAAGRWLSYSYDSAGRRTRMVDQAGNITNYSYNPLGYLNRLTDGSGALIAAYSYDAAGRLIRGDNGNSTYTTYSYDATGQLLSLVNHQADGTVNSSFSYTYDAMGRRTSVTTLEGTTSYEYDAIGQLTGVTLPTGRHIAYRYDAAGNRISVDDNGALTNYSTNDLNQYTSAGGATYSYDADGNLVSKLENGVLTTYGYDVENRLISVANATDLWTYEYDAMGNRIATVHNGARVEYQLDPTGMVNVAGEYDASGNLIAAYTHGLGLESQYGAGDAYFYDFDAIGSTTGLTGASGGYLNQYSYLPFGENLTTSETVANDFEYVGQWGVMDAGNGLDFMRARFYSEAEGRFISQDPLGILGGDYNLKRYVHNDPVSMVDPSGLEAQWNKDLTPEQRSDRLRELLEYEKKNGTNAAASKYNPTGGDDSIYLRNFDDRYITTNYSGDLDLDWMMTLVAYSKQYNIPPEYLYSFGKELWSILDFQYYQQHQKTIYNHAELVAVAIANEIYHGKSFQEAFEDWGVKAKGTTQVIVPKDPNDILGPHGFGEEQWVSSKEALPYTIRFENQPAATAPAQQVSITQPLDSDLDLRSFRLGDFGWGDLIVDVPENASFYSQRLDLRATQGIYVDVVAGIDIATRQAFWTLTTIDPATGQPTQDALMGFLPPTTEDGSGQGFVSYTVKAGRTATTGTRIDAQVRIVFDTEEPIDTPAIFNTLDVTAPNSQVAVLPTETDNPEFLVSWNGADDATGSAIAGYTIYVTEDNGPYTAWLTNTTLTESLFTGRTGHSYAFYSVATDNAGNRETTPAVADAEITVGQVNTPPVATDDAFITEEDNALTGNLLANDSDADANPLTAVLVTGPNHGTLILNTDGSFTYIPTTNFNGTDSFTYLANDGTINGNEAMVTMTINPVNDGPTGAATAILPAGAEDTAYIVSAADLLTGFSDVDGDILSLTGLSADHGDVVVNGDGTFTITPALNSNGPVNLSYSVVDGMGGTVAASQSFTLTPVNDAPTGTTNASLPAGAEDTAYIISAADLLTGFSDVDGDTLSVTGLVANHGTVIDNNDGTFTITPALNYNGPVSLSYSVSDGMGGMVAASQIFTLAPVNDAPTGTATAILPAGAEDNAYTVSAVDLLAGFGDVDGDNLSVTGLVANHGNVTDNGDGTFTITPTLNSNGPVNLSYSVVDGMGGTIAAIQSFTLIPVNDAPTGTATAVLSAGSEDTAYTVSAADLLAGFGDVDGDTLSVTGLVANHGNVTDNGDGTFTITPALNYNGPVNLSYNVVDSMGGMVAASQSFTLAPVNDAPTGFATASLPAGTEDSAYIVSAADLLTGFSDVDGDILSLTGLVANHGTVTDNNDGTFTITPTLNYNGPINLNYNVVDGMGYMVAASQSFTLAPVNDMPTGFATVSLPAGSEDSAYIVSAVDLLTGFSDIDGDTLSLTGLVADHGTVTDNNDGTFTITPTLNYNGPVTLNYSVTDGQGGMVAASQSFTLAPVNDAPTGFATATLPAGTEDIAYIVSAADLLAGFSDVDGDTLFLTDLVASHGTVTDNGNGTITITPTLNYNGPVNLSYNVIDGHGGTIAASQIFTLTPVNDAPTGAATATLPAGSEDAAYTVSAADLLTGFSDVDGDVLNVAGLVANHGTVTNNGNGTFTITPAVNHNGPINLSYNVVDGHGGSIAASQIFTLAAVNDAPTGIATASLPAGAEDTTYIVSATDLLAGFSDVDGDTLSVTGLVANHGTVTDNGDGTFTITPTLNFNGPVNLSYNVVDGQGGTVAGSQSFTLAAMNDAPVGVNDTASGNEDTVISGNVLTNDSDPNGDTLSAILVAGPSHGSLTLNANGSFTYTPSANFFGTDSFTYKANDGITGSNTATVSITVAPKPLLVTSAVATSTGIRLTFNHALDTNTLNLYGLSGTVADLSLVGASTGTVKGSFMVEDSGKALTFIKTGGVLAADTYTLTLRSAADGFRDSEGRLLDGNSDGTAGDNFTTTFTVGATTRTLSIPDFARGPGQTVDVKAADLNSDLPIRLSNGSGITQVSFTLRYDPSLLTISNVQRGNLPTGATLSFTNDTATGTLTVQINSTTALSATTSAIDLVKLTASVPSTATYRDKQILNLTNLSLNNGTVAVTDDDGFQLVAYLGDTTGNKVITSNDYLLVPNVAVRRNSGFAAYASVDPTLIADINGNGAVDATDALLISNEAKSYLPGYSSSNRPEIPDLPAGVTAAEPVGPDPFVSIPTSLTARRGELVTVPVLVDPADGLFSAQISLAYDPSVLELVEVRRGDMTQNFGIFLYGAADGLLKIDMNGGAKTVNSGTGSIALAVFRVIGLPATGSTAMDLQWVNLNDGQMVLTPVPVPGEDATDGRLTVTAAAKQTKRSVVPVPARTSQTMHEVGADLWRKLVTPSGATPSNTTSGLIQWNTVPAEMSPATTKVQKSAAQGWMTTFATTLAEEVANPNNRIKVTLPNTQHEVGGTMKNGVLTEKSIDTLTLV